MRVVGNDANTSRLAMTCRTMTSQAIWEASFNVMPLFTEEDKIFVEEKKQKGREESGIKAVARRFEAEIVEVSCFSVRTRYIPGAASRLRK